MSQTTSLYHITRPSILTKNAPVLIMFHGYGSDENDLFSFANELPKELFIISVRAPYKMQPYGNAWYAINFDEDKGKWSDTQQAIKSRDLIAGFIDEVTTIYPVNKNNVTLLGFSQGSILSYSVAFTYPEKVNQIIALSGYINHDLHTLKSQNHYKNLAFFCSHGTVDQVIPVDWARQTTTVLKSLAIDHKYKEYPVGHGVAPQNFHDLKAWLEGKL